MWKKLITSLIVLATIIAISTWALFFSQTDMDESVLPPFPIRPKLPTDSENGFIDFLSACSLVQEAPYLDEYEFEDWDVVTLDISKAEADLALNQPAFNAIETALSKPYFINPFFGTGVERNINYLTGSREITRLRMFQIKISNTQNDHEESLSQIHLGLQRSKKQLDSSTTLVESLVGLATYGIIQRSTINTAYRFHNNIEIQKRILKELKSSRLSINSLMTALAGELLEMRITMTKNQNHDDLFSYSDLTGNEFIDDLLRTHQFKPTTTLHWRYQKLDEIQKQINLPFKDMKESRIDKLRNLDTFQKLRTGNAIGINELIFNDLSYLKKFRIAIYTHEIIETAIALRIYELKNGKLPNTLEELKPDYLDFIATDIFDGKPLRYDPKKHMIWSVNEDYIDNGGKIRNRDGSVPGLKPDGTYEPYTFQNLDMSDDMGFYLMPGPPKKP